MKQLYIVNDIPEYEGDGPNYFYVVRANDYKDAIEIVKAKLEEKNCCLKQRWWIIMKYGSKI